MDGLHLGLKVLDGSPWIDYAAVQQKLNEVDPAEEARDFTPKSYRHKETPCNTVDLLMIYKSCIAHNKEYTVIPIV